MSKRWPIDKHLQKNGKNKIIRRATVVKGDPV